ncbi:COP23 domain-containing protein [Fortiea contorta]|uniref:COP23 domain-containing protein n=1 Tax=Fortiea contorta TaxID=1892405 RepID=UPI00034A3496|nr:COP23 domain-containing protein [Fortiea contorta]
MKIKLASLTVGAMMGAIALTANFNQPSYAQNSTFYCGVSQGAPATIARTPNGNITVIRWVSAHFDEAGYDPQRRCEEVSGRFQTYKNNGTLNYITTGIMNSQPVVCVSSTNGGGCNGLLFTLKPRQNASKVVQQLFNVRVGASGPLNESSERVYIDVNQLLNSSATENNNSPNEKPKLPTPGNSQPLF